MRYSGIVFLFLWVLAQAGQEAHAQGTGIHWVAQGPAASDFDADGSVGFSDFLILARGFNTRTGDAGFDTRLDLNGDGTVNFADFLSFSTSYGLQSGAPTSTRYAVYLADPGNSAVVAFDFDTHLLIDFLPFRVPTGLRISRDEQTIYVAEVFAVFALTAQHEVRFSVPMNTATRIALDPQEKFAYVTDESNRRLVILDMTAQAPVDTITLGVRPSDVEITPDGKKLYVANIGSNNVSVIDLAQRTETGRIQIGAAPSEIAITPDGQRAYVTNFNRGVISVLDLRTDRVVGAIQLDGEGGRGLQFSPDGKKLYANSEGTLLEIDVQRNLILRSLVLGDDTSSLGISPDGSRAYVGTLLFDAGGPGLTAVDLVNWQILGRMLGVNFPVEIHFRKLPPRQSIQ